MNENIFANGIAEIFGTKKQVVETLVVNNEVLNKMANKMEDPECIIEVTVSTSSKNLPIMEARISKGQGSTSEWTYATNDVIIKAVKAFRNQDPEALKTEDEIKVKAAGGVRTLADAYAMIEAGAERIGTSAGVTIVEELKALQK